MRNNLSVKQNGFKDCAAACLLSIMRFYGGNISKEEISYLIKTDIHGTNAYNLIEGMKKIGFDGYGMKITFNNFIKINLDTPVIAHLKESNMYHYVVVYEIHKKYIKVMDPACGMKKVSYENFKEMYLETILFLYPTKPLPNIKLKSDIFGRILADIFLNKKYVIKLIITTLIVTVLGIMVNFYLKIYIDYVYLNFSLNLLLKVSCCFLGLIFLKNIFDNVRGKILIKIKSTVDSNITNNTINHIMNLPYCHIKNKPSGEVVSRIDDLDNLKELVSSVILNTFVNILIMIGSMIILLLINKTLFFISIVIILLYSLVAYIYSKIFKNKIDDVQTLQGEYKKELIETINAYETLKNLNLIEDFIYKVKIKFNALLFKIKNFEYSYSNEKMFKNSINEAGMIIITAVGLSIVSQNVITIGDLVAFTSLALFFIEPVKELLNMIPLITYARGSYERINDLLIIEKESTNNMEKQMIRGNLVVKNLTYSYNSIDNVFENINFTIPAGGHFLIYGKSGSGKSTLIKILMGYLKEYKGEVYINNINIQDIAPDIIRNTFSYVSQKEVLFAETIKNNILLGRDISQREYNEVLNICNIDSILKSRKSRGSFLLEENGFNLSGGERQKIILARGLLKSSNIIILDEALSEIGFQEEKEIIERILKKYEKKTIIYISHKKEILSMFKNRYFFEEGRTYAK